MSHFKLGDLEISTLGGRKGDPIGDGDVRDDMSTLSDDVSTITVCNKETPYAMLYHVQAPFHL